MSFEMIDPSYSPALSRYVTPKELRFGWAGPEAAARQFDMLGEYEGYVEFGSTPVASAPMASTVWRAWEPVRKLIGKDLDCYPQQTSDCVAAALADAVMMTQLLEIAAGESEEFRRVFVPWYYYTSRMLVGKGQLGPGGGSVGSWAAEALKLYGTLDAATTGLPQYGRQLADRWGNGKDVPAMAMNVAKPYTIRNYTFVKNWDQLVRLAQSGYLMTVASDIGFNDLPARDGFHRIGGICNHQMGIWALSNDSRKPWVGVHNNWGDVHSQLIDFDTGEPWPKGMMRWRPEDLDRAFRRGEVIAYSGFNGFEDRSAKYRQFSMVD
jgi:hypothetical protein